MLSSLLAFLSDIWGYVRIPGSNQQYPPTGSPSPSDVRNGGMQSRNQSPQNLQHSPYSYPMPNNNGPPASLSQNMVALSQNMGSMTIQAPQPRTPNGGSYPPPSSLSNANGDWTPPQMSQPSSRPPSRPSSYIQARSSGDGAHPFSSNSHAAQAVRQRI